jgi:hypothetical protein
VTFTVARGNVPTCPGKIEMTMYVSLNRKKDCLIKYLVFSIWFILVK